MNKLICTQSCKLEAGHQGHCSTTPNRLTSCREEFERWVENSDHGTMPVSEWMWLAWSAAWEHPNKDSDNA